MNELALTNDRKHKASADLAMNIVSPGLITENQQVGLPLRDAQLVTLDPRE
ncbi:hypothetical protein BSU04_36250 [Caballeronia sordidicola]|uniref:Uncharacterized protein n=1 Tax=Caballeronia sordidicola TaxID=196367 RepID=A0A226WS76_CABSO|nr:hypothetical protein BSU04_36250 [Caballeronia sordidicola]